MTKTRYCRLSYGKAACGGGGADSLEQKLQDDVQAIRALSETDRRVLWALLSALGLTRPQQDEQRGPLVGVGPPERFDQA